VVHLPTKCSFWKFLFVLFPFVVSVFVVHLPTKWFPASIYLFCFFS